MTANYEYSCSNRENLPNLTFFQLLLISQLCLHYFRKLKYCFEIQKLFLLFPFRVCICYFSYFTSFVHPMQSKALQPSFHCALAFLQWHFVLVVKYQVNFCKAETSHLKSILSNHTAKLCFICKVMRFAKIQPCSQGCYFIDFMLFLFG